MRYNFRIQQIIDRLREIYKFITVDHLLLGMLQDGILDKYLVDKQVKLNIIPILKQEVEKITCTQEVNYDANKLNFNIEKEQEINELDIIEEMLKRESFVRDCLQQCGITASKLSLFNIQNKAMVEFVESISYDLTELAEQGKIDPIYSRDEEIENGIIYLSKKNKNNILFLGQPGVGKTAIVEAIAQRIVDGNVPYKLKNRRLRVLELNRLIADTKYRGEFEEKITKVLNYMIEANDIIFIDEIHTVINTGESEGGMSAANILKPYLVRNDIQFIGATTEDEYIKYIKQDGALDRRFGTIYVTPFSVEQMTTLIGNFKNTYEDYHKITYSNQDLIKILDDLEQVKSKHFPDKFLDLIDFVGAKHQRSRDIIDYKILHENISIIFGGKYE